MFSILLKSRITGATWELREDMDGDYIQKELDEIRKNFPDADIVLSYVEPINGAITEGSTVKECLENIKTMYNECGYLF